MTKKDKIDNILKKSHLIINDATGIDISKTQKAAAKRESRKILRELKEVDIVIYNIVKEEFDG
tara:strand:+ start:617 stop:805 length:189 start_codon:yes stop_codon:yes gene_type:complete